MKRKKTIPLSITIIILIISINQNTYPEINEQDSLALVTFYNSTNGNNWHIKTNWLSDQPVDTWAGVTADSGRVRSIFLIRNNLTGSIPPAIGNLTDLRLLHLDRNNLEDSIPSQINNLIKLESLNLYHNKLTGELPPEIGNMTQLTHINLSKNSFTGTIPAEFGNLINIQRLNLAGNKLTGAVPPEIANLTNLILLDLHDNQLTDLPDLSSIKSLSQPRIEKNRFTFEDIEPNAGISSIIYSPQDSIGIAQDTTIDPGSSLTLSVTVGGTANHYQWTIDSTAIPGADSSLYFIDSTSAKDEGEYICKITNTIAPLLTLYSRPVNVTIKDPVNNRQDSLALVTLYTSTNGANWRTKTNWLSDKPVDTWYGVTIDSGRVRRIVLRDNNLAGSIPPEIGNLTDLRSINLRENHLAGSIPSQIGSLTKLDSLDIHYNQLTGELPPEMGNMTQLSYINLSKNFLTGTIPNEFTNLSNLETLIIVCNHLSGNFPIPVLSLTQLINLWLQWNQFTGTIPPEIGNLTNLVALGLHSNQFTGEYPKELGNLVNMRFLDLGNLPVYEIYPSNNQCTGSIPKEIGNLINLERLWIRNEENLTGPIPSEFGNLTNINELNLQNNKLTGAVPQEIANLTNLIFLDLHGNQLTDLPDLSSIKSLSQPQIQENQFTFEDIEPNADIYAIIYSPQDSIGIAQDTTIDTGSSLMLSVTVGGTANHYQWTKNGAEIPGTDSSSYFINSASAADGGEYICKITNTIAPLLTLYSRPVNVTIKDPANNRQDSLALVTFYNSTNGDNWETKINWLSNQPVDTWYGVFVNSGRVRRIVLRDNNLAGSISPEIGNLTDLRSINLRQNHLTGSIPSQIGSLTKLDSLDIYHNQLTGELPPEMGNMTQLSFINLENNLLTGTIPKEFTNLGNLKTLAISCNHLSGDFPMHILNMTQLTHLWFQWNQFTGTIPPEIGNLTNLEALGLHSNQFTGEYPKELGNLVNLRFLYLGNFPVYEVYPSNNRCTGSIPKEIGNLVNLERLWIRNEENLTGPIPSEFGNLKHIHDLDLQRNKLTGAVPQEIVNLRYLKSFDLQSNQLTDLPDLSSMKNIRYVQMQKNQFTFEDIEPNIDIFSIIYSPQNNIGIAQDTTIDAGSSLTFSVTVGGTANHYQWTKYGAEIPGADSSSYFIDSASAADEGEYICKITNTIAPLLTLYSRPVNVTIRGATHIAMNSIQAPKVFALYQNYPNPFNPVTSIQYELPECTHVILKIFNYRGQEVITLINGIREPGYHQIDWDSRDNSGQMVSTGIYIYQIKTENNVAAQKMILQF
jgi:Leucine-rich repeat (LRR) protein